MRSLIELIVLFPFAGFLILSVFGKILNKKLIGLTGVGTTGLSALMTLIVGVKFLTTPNTVLTASLWSWFDVSGFHPQIAFHVDSLSFVFVFVVTLVGFLIHLYSAEFMKDDQGYARFFAYMNLFVGSMLVLVLADNLLLLYLGWEGVGLCSFLLIGFWYKEPENAAAARKAFIVTRVGDTAMAIGLFMLFYHFSTLDIQVLMDKIPGQWATGSPLATTAALLLLGGAVGKSAQLPLQTWLPDAMAGPSPVSALIHAATMVTAGVYLIARTHVLFIQSPFTMMIISIIGAATLLIAGFSAMAQYDIKKVLAYSTISQIGYMFLALGIGAWSAAIFHFMIHAFFKALLFLGAGAVILAMHHEHDMFKMGGLKKQLPVTFWTFLIGSASLAALPLITAGFYSKDQILWYAWAGEMGGPWLWLAGIIGAFITAVYTFRMIFITFYGEQKTEAHQKPGVMIKIPLIALAVLSLVGGFINLPHNFGHFALFSRFVNQTLPGIEITSEMESLEWVMQLISAALALTGVYLAYLFYLKKSAAYNNISANVAGLKNFFLYGWNFDKLYDRVFVRPVITLSRINRKDFVDLIYTGMANVSLFFNGMLSKTQTGNVRWYIMGIVFGAIVLIAIIYTL
jgi:NADH-quinone oxidoreductase subunit L